MAFPPFTFGATPWNLPAPPPAPPAAWTGLTPTTGGWAGTLTAPAPQGAFPTFATPGAAPLTSTGIEAASAPGMFARAGNALGLAKTGLQLAAPSVLGGSALQNLGHSTGFHPLEGIGGATTALGVPAAGALYAMGGMGATAAGAAGAGAGAAGGALGETLLHQAPIESGLNAIRSHLGMDQLNPESFSLTNLIQPGGALSHLPFVGQGDAVDPLNQGGVNLDPKALAAKLDLLHLSPQARAAVVENYNKDYQSAMQMGLPYEQALKSTYDKYFGTEATSTAKAAPGLIATQFANAAPPGQTPASDAFQAQNAAQAQAQSQARAAVALQQAFSGMASQLTPAGANPATAAYMQGIAPAATTAAQLQTANDLYKQQLQAQQAQYNEMNRYLAQAAALKAAAPDQAAALNAQAGAAVQ